MTSQCQQRLSFCSIDIFFCHRVDIHQFGCHRGYHFAALTSFSATGSTFTSLVDIHQFGCHHDNQTGECRPCGRKRCQCCKMITSAGTVKSSSGATVRLRQNTDRTTENVVYLISCSSCNKQYVGETKGPLNKRMKGHRDDWRHRMFERSPTAEHFHSADHDFLSNASVCCLEHNKEWSDSTRKLRESYWIRRLNTLCPFGINKGD